MDIYRTGLILAGGFFVLFANIKTLKNYTKAIYNKEKPQAILVLGGDIEREHIGIYIARKLSLPLVISSGSNPEHAEWLIEKAEILKSHVTLDYAANDTLTNFTSLVDKFSSKKFNHILVVTSEDHLPRAKIVGSIISGSQGIRLTTIPVSCKNQCIKESFQKKAFDLVRAIFWVATRKDLKVFFEKKFQENFYNNFNKLFKITSIFLDPTLS